MNRIKRPGFLTILCIVLGIAALIIGASSIAKRSKFLPAEATITRIDEYYDDLQEEYQHSTFGKYIVDGKIYEDNLGYYDPKFKEGDVIEIRYNPENPAEIIAASLGFLIYLVIIGPVLIAVGIFLFLKGRI